MGSRPRAEVFKSCPGCKNKELLEFEGEVFCARCSWDSILIHAEVLAEAQLLRQRRRAKSGTDTTIVTPKRESSAYLAWFMPTETQGPQRGRLSGAATGNGLWDIDMTGSLFFALQMLREIPTKKETATRALHLVRRLRACHHRGGTSALHGKENEVRKGMNALKKFFQRTAELWASAERDGAIMDQKVQEAKDRLYEKHGIYFRWRF